MSSPEDSEQNKITKLKEDKMQINKLKNYIPIMVDDKSVKDYFKLTKQYRQVKKQHTLKIKVFKKHYKKDVLQLKNKYKMYYNIVNKDYNTSLTSIQNNLKLINYHNVFYKQITNYMNMLFEKYDHNIVFRAFYFSFILDIYIMIQYDEQCINLNKLTEQEQKHFINKTINHLLHFYNGFVPKKEYKFYSLEFTTKHFNEDSNFEDEQYDCFKNNPEFAIFYNICYNLHFIRREIVLNYVKLDKIFENYYTGIKQKFNKKYFKNNFGIMELQNDCDNYISKIHSIYNDEFSYEFPFGRMNLIYIFGDVLYQPPKDGCYGFDNRYSFTKYFEQFLEQIPYNDFYFSGLRGVFDNEIDYSDYEEDEPDDEDEPDEEDEEDEDEPDDEED